MTIGYIVTALLICVNPSASYKYIDWFAHKEQMEYVVKTLGDGEWFEVKGRGQCVFKNVSVKEGPKP